MSGAIEGPISASASLLRRIHPDQVVDDKNTGGRRFSSAAFKDQNMSVDVEEMLAEQGLDFNFSLRDHSGYSLARLAVAAALAENQSVIHCRVEGNDAHAEVRGKKSPGIANRLLAASHPVVLDGKLFGG
jgi:hypothetical protein